HISQPFTQVLRKMTHVSLTHRYHSVQPILQDLKFKSSYDDLAQYLVKQPQPKTNTSTHQDGSSRQGYRTPAAKKAIAIRDWKQRRDKKRRRPSQPPLGNSS
ncbi:MAG: serine/threonine protein kinase, partial [Coleofasciculus sp. C2-GNP5-27]